MIVFRAPGEVPAGFGPSVVVIGKFDGVHSGHRAVIDRARVTATDADARVVAVTFDRNPLSLLRPELCPDPLSSVEQKLELLAEAGVDATLVLRFDAELAGLEPRAFVEHVLVDALGVVTVMVGDDFRFGRGGAGDPALLISLGAEFGFEVDVVGDVQGGGRRVSSTWVRDLLSVGDVEGAARLLGRPHAMAGEVVHGLKRGRELGFPTANLAPDADGFIPGDGVYAGWLRRLDQPDAPKLPAAISVGTNPTFDGIERRVESYVLDRADLDLYGVELGVEFVEHLRGQIKFASVDDLIAQMTTDVVNTRRALGIA